MKVFFRKVGQDLRQCAAESVSANPLDLLLASIFLPILGAFCFLTLLVWPFSKLFFWMEPTDKTRAIPGLLVGAALSAICSSALAGDCRQVVQVHAVKAVAYRQTYVAPTHYQAAIVAIEQPYYAVEVIAPELRAKQRAKEQSQALEDQVEINRQQTEQIKLLTQMVLSSKGGTDGAGPLAMQSSEDSKVVGILRTRCAKCHSGDGSKGDVRLFEADGKAVAFTPQMKLLVESVTNDNSMPPAGDKLTTDEYQAVRKWYEADRAAIRSAVKAAKKE